MTGPLLTYALGFGFGALGLALALNLWRLFRGPGLTDRILALDTMVINVIGLIVLTGIASGSGTSFEAALLLAMVGFVGTVAYAKFLLRGDIIE
jgi:multicomponent K+:H+ antiporter subunit F